MGEAHRAQGSPRGTRCCAYRAGEGPNGPRRCTRWRACAATTLNCLCTAASGCFPGGTPAQCLRISQACFQNTIHHRVAIIARLLLRPDALPHNVTQVCCLVYKCALLIQYTGQCKGVKPGACRGEAGPTSPGLDGALDEALALLQEDAFVVQCGPMEYASHTLHNNAHRGSPQQPHCHWLVCASDTAL